MKRLTKNPQGLLCIDNQIVTVLQCFPWLKKREHLSFVNNKNQEVLYLGDLRELDPPSSKLLINYLDEYDDKMFIKEIKDISEGVELRKYTVICNFGARIFYTSVDHWPFQNDLNEIMIEDIHGDLYCIKCLDELDKKSFKFIKPFIP